MTATLGEPVNKSPETEHIDTDVLSPAPDGMEVVGWLVAHPKDDRYPFGERDLTFQDLAEGDVADGWTQEALVTRSQAQSALAAMRLERDEAQLREGALMRDCEVYKGHAADQLERALAAEAQLKRLTEDNEALRRELQDWQNGHGKSVRAHAEALARIEILEETLRPFSVLELPRLKNAGNAGFYNLRFADIASARATLNSREKADG